MSENYHLIPTNLMEPDDSSLLSFFEELTTNNNSDGYVDPTSDFIFNGGTSEQKHINVMSSAPGSSDSLDVKMTLHSWIKEKMKAEGKEQIVENSTIASVELTPEDRQKRLEKQERNKEAARKSRQKKKECDSKLKKDNESLQLTNSELKRDVKQLKIAIKVFEDYLNYEDYLTYHIPACRAQNIVPQQDHGDSICQETSSNQLCRRDVTTPNATIWDANDDAYMDKILNDIDGLNVSVKWGPQQKHQILSSLQGDQTQQLVTSSSIYEINTQLLNPCYGIGVQENAEPYTFSKNVEPNFPIVNFETSGSSNIQTAEYETNGVIESNTFSSNLCNSVTKGTYISPWSTDTDDQSDRMEALQEVSRSITKPPPEKRPRLE